MVQPVRTETGDRLEITRLDPESCGKVNAIFGLVTGILGGLFSLIGSNIVATYLSTIPGMDSHLVEQAQQAGFVGLILFILLGVVLGFLSGLVIAVVYNFVAKLAGGVKIYVQK